MEITIDCQRPIQLTSSKKLIVAADDLSEEVENVPGVYYFSRKH